MGLLTPDQQRFSLAGVDPGSLLWLGRPGNGIRFQPSDAFAVPFAAVWTGVLIVFFLPRMFEGGGGIGWVMGPVFLAVGLYMLVGRFIVDGFVRSRSLYGLSRDAAYIVRNVPISGGLVRINLASVQAIGLKVRSDGRGTITFGEVPSSFAWGSQPPPPPAFEFIAEPLKVYELCTKAKPT